MSGWFFQTKAGMVSIRPDGKRWCVFFEEENLGSYHSPKVAADDVSGGHTFSPSGGIDLGSLGIPCDVDEWTPFDTKRL